MAMGADARRRFVTAEATGPSSEGRVRGHGSKLGVDEIRATTRFGFEIKPSESAACRRLEGYGGGGCGAVEVGGTGSSGGAGDSPPSPVCAEASGAASVGSISFG